MPPQSISHIRTITTKRRVSDLAALVAEPVVAGLDDLLNRQVLAHPGMKTVHACAKGTLKAPQGFHLIGHPKTPGIDGAVATCLDMEMCSCRSAPSPPVGLRQAIPSAPADPVLHEVASLDEHPQMLLQGVAAGAGQGDRIAYGDAAMVADVIDDPQGQLRYGREQELLALDLVGQAAHLLLHRPQEEPQPGLPVGT